MGIDGTKVVNYGMDISTIGITLEAGGLTMSLAVAVIGSGIQSKMLL